MPPATLLCIYEGGSSTCTPHCLPLRRWYPTRFPAVNTPGPRVIFAYGVIEDPNYDPSIPPRSSAPESRIFTPFSVIAHHPIQPLTIYCTLCSFCHRFPKLEKASTRRWTRVHLQNVLHSNFSWFSKLDIETFLHMTL